MDTYIEFPRDLGSNLTMNNGVLGSFWRSFVESESVEINFGFSGDAKWD